MKWLKLAEVTQPGAYVRRRIGEPTDIALFYWTVGKAVLSEPAGVPGYRYFGPIPEPDEYTWRWPNAEARMIQEVSKDQINCRGLQMDTEYKYVLIEFNELTGLKRWQQVL
jgi:hypothetical protein